MTVSELGSFDLSGYTVYNTLHSLVLLRKLGVAGPRVTQREEKLLLQL